MFQKSWMSIVLAIALVAGQVQGQEVQEVGKVRPVPVNKKSIADTLLETGVTIRAGFGEGSGTLVTKKVKVGDEEVLMSFVWTAAHVVDGARIVRKIIDPKTGAVRTIIQFKDVEIIKEHVYDGRTVGESKMFAKVLLYSDSEDGEDLALLIIRKPGFSTVSAKFYLDKPIPKVGSQLFHVGSLLGQDGHNSFTDGIISRVGRVFDLGSGDGVVFDQTTVTAFPGSSGGGVFLADGRYMGMLVRGAGETFNFVVPVRRMKAWAKERGIMWALNNDPAPSWNELKKIKPEDQTVGSASNSRTIKHKTFLKINKKAEVSPEAVKALIMLKALQGLK